MNAHVKHDPLVHLLMNHSDLQKKVLKALVQRAMNVAKAVSVSSQGVKPRVEELAHLVHDIWTSKDRSFLYSGSGYRFDRNLYHTTITRGGIKSWRNYIQTTILGFDAKDEEAKGIVKWNLLPQCTNVVPEVIKKKWNESDDTRQTWHSVKLLAALKKYEDTPI